jgi:hypothetical protein
MKSKLKTTAQFLMLFAACLTAVAQTEINPDHFADDPSQSAFAPRQLAQANTLQSRLNSYEQIMQAKLEQVEAARQEAISAAAMGDGASAYIHVYQQQQMEADALRVALAPEMDQTRKLMAGLDSPNNIR